MLAPHGAPKRWECPACGKTSVTNTAQPHTQMHHCTALKGLVVPMVPAGTKAKIVANERMDYVNGEKVQVDGEGRPIMSVVITRDEGQDCVVFAPSASASGEASSYGLD